MKGFRMYNQTVRLFLSYIIIYKQDEKGNEKKNITFFAQSVKTYVKKNWLVSLLYTGNVNAAIFFSSTVKAVKTYLLTEQKLSVSSLVYYCLRKLKVFGKLHHQAKKLYFRKLKVKVL